MGLGDTDHTHPRPWEGPSLLETRASVPPTPGQGRGSVLAQGWALSVPAAGAAAREGPSCHNEAFERLQAGAQLSLKAWLS